MNGHRDVRDLPEQDHHRSFKDPLPSAPKVIIAPSCCHLLVMFKRLMVPVDLSPQSFLMVEVASRMSHYGVQEVLVYSLVQEPSRKESMLELMDSKLREAGMDHRLLVETGSDAPRAIVKAAEANEVGMIAMAASGKGRVREFFVGSTSLAVIRRTPVPVLLDKFPLDANEDPEGYCERCPPLLDSVLVSLDLSRVSRHMLPFVQSIIDAGAKRVTLFHVVQASRYKMDDDHRFREVRRKLDAYRKKLRAGDCAIDLHIHFGTTTYNILEVAREVEATVIVMGTTGKSYLRGVTLGSTSEEVVKASTRPVLLIPA